MTCNYSRRIKKTMSLLLTLVISLMMFSSVRPRMIVIGAIGNEYQSQGSLQIKRPNEIYVATIEGGSPSTVDPAWSYDTASGEFILNMYEPLIFFDGERTDLFIPMLSTAVPDIVNVPNALVENITGTGSGYSTSMYTQNWYWRIIFPVRSGVLFHNTSFMLTPADVEYSLERCLVQNRRNGPTSMLYELFFGAGIYNPWYLGNLSDPEDVVTVGHMLDAAVGSNSTHAWISMGSGNPRGVFPPTLQILAQTWGSILSKAWVNDVVIGVHSREEWSGNWGTYSYDDWLKYRRPVRSPLDNPTPLACGTGPFYFVTWDTVSEYWEVHAFNDYWGGWPAKFPAPPYPSYGPGTHIPPAGNITSIMVTWAYNWDVRKSMFLAGDVDFCAVPREYKDEVLNKPGIRCMYPLPALTVRNMFFNFEVTWPPSSASPPPGFDVYDAGVFAEDGIPKDFFGNATWGIHTRKAFTYALDYDALTGPGPMYGEVVRSATALIPGLTVGTGVLYNPLPLWYSPYRYYNLTKAEEEFKLVNNGTHSLWETGFTVFITYYDGNLLDMMVADLLKIGIESLNPKFHVIKLEVPLDPFWPRFKEEELPLWVMGWLGDYSDVHNFAFPFYHSQGDLVFFMHYNNPTMDDLIEQGVSETNVTIRQAIYRQIEQLALDDCPSVALCQSIGRHFERDWINDWYYNQILQGLYAYPIWKAYYTPHKLLSDYQQPESSFIAFDVTYNGIVDMTDIGFAAMAYGSSYGPPIRTRWNFRCDVDNNRQVDMADIGYIAMYYGR